MQLFNSQLLQIVDIVPISEVCCKGQLVAIALSSPEIPCKTFQLKFLDSTIK